jgi:hypothetical protein
LSFTSDIHLSGFVLLFPWLHPSINTSTNEVRCHPQMRHDRNTMQWNAFSIDSQCIHRNVLGQIFLHVFWKFCSSLRPEKLFTTLTFTEISTVEVYIHHTYTESDSQILGLRPFRSEAARIFADCRKTIGILGLVSVNPIIR